MAEGDKLPRLLPIFPLSGVVLLPGARLPLRVFEFRYLEMTADIIESHRMVGMIQPRDVLRDPVPEDAPIFDVGCVGELVEANDLQDGTVAISVQGIRRFRVVEETGLETSYRNVVADYGDFADDRDFAAQRLDDRAGLLSALEAYLPRLGGSGHQEGLERTDDATLTSLLTMTLPFGNQEKQALLEAPTVAERGRMLTTLMRIAAAGGDDGQPLQ